MTRSHRTPAALGTTLAAATYQGVIDMLVLSRKAGERIRIGKDVEITILRLTGGRVQIGVAAPRDVKVARGELIDKGHKDAA